jgi:hypothetical protein
MLSTQMNSHVGSLAIVSQTSEFEVYTAGSSSATIRGQLV